MKTITFRPSKKNAALIAQLTELANKQNRNLNNYIETVLIGHVKIQYATNEELRSDKK